MLHAVVKDFSNGGLFSAHHPLHAIYRTYHMGAVDHPVAANAYKQVFGMVCHSHNLMGNDLTGRNDQIVCRIHDPVVNQDPPQVSALKRLLQSSAEFIICKAALLADNKISSMSRLSFLLVQ